MSSLCLGIGVQVQCGLVWSNLFKMYEEGNSPKNYSNPETEIIQNKLHGLKVSKDQDPAQESHTIGCVGTRSSRGEQGTITNTLRLRRLRKNIQAINNHP